MRASCTFATSAAPSGGSVIANVIPTRGTACSTSAAATAGHGGSTGALSARISLGVEMRWGRAFRTARTTRARLLLGTDGPHK